jgi:hypothetical protein
MNTTTHTIHHSTNQILIDQCAERLGIPSQLLSDWVHQQPKHHQLAMNQLLHVAHRYGLDPLTEEVILMDDEEHLLRPFITLDGWMHVLNEQTHFCGIQFRESTECIEGIPSYMECTIYRDDRVMPITIKEYYQEIKTEHAVWEHLPRRMMRHRALQQCVRLAFGISCPEKYHAKNQIIMTEEKVASSIEKKVNQKTDLLKKVLQEKLKS